MLSLKKRRGKLIKGIAALLVCLCIVNETGGANFSPSVIPFQAATLAVESRLKPFFEKHGLDFRVMATVAYAARTLRDRIMTGALRESHIVKLNEHFTDGNVEIEKNGREDSLQCTGKQYHSIVFRFKKENKMIKALFLEDPGALTDEEKRELRIGQDEARHLLYPGLEGIWFVAQSIEPYIPESEAAKVEPKNRQRSAPTFANINLFGPCNMRCKFCIGCDLKAEFDQYNQLKEHYSKWRNLPAYLDNIREAGIDKICISGQNTDPLLYRYLGELVDYLHAQGFKVSLRTNGLLAKERMDVINRFDSVSYSILSLNPDTLYEIAECRKIVDWAYVLRNTTARFRVATVVCRENAHEVPEIMRFLSGFPEISYVQIRKILTDTRPGLLEEDMNAFERLREDVSERCPEVDQYEGAPIYLLENKRVIFWNLAQTTANSWNYWTNGVYSDNYFDIEGYLASRHMVTISDRHTICRTSQYYDYPERYVIPDGRVSWGREWPDYKPEYFDHPLVLAEWNKHSENGWAHHEDPRQAAIAESSYEGLIRIDDNGYPLNPKGRTGLAGRGILGKWGANYAIDPVITRWNETLEQYEILVVERGEIDQLSIPGVMVLDGETGFEALNRRLGEKIGVEFSMKGAVRLYQGYVDDPRNTDNAWMETEVWHLHMPHEATKGMDAQLGTWAEWMPLTDEHTREMYANHGEFARLVLNRIRPDKPSGSKSKTALLKDFEHMINTGKPPLVVFDVHGTLLEPTWRREWRLIYKEITKREMSEEWMERFVAPNPRDEIIRALSEHAGVPVEEVTATVRKMRAGMRRGDLAVAQQGALAFVKELYDARVPMVITSGSNRDVVIRQLQKAGFMKYFSEDDILTAPGGQIHVEGDLSAAMHHIAERHPGHTMVLFDDWHMRVTAVKKLGGVIFGLPQGTGKEFAVNRDRLLITGADFVLEGWEYGPDIAQVLQRVNDPFLESPEITENLDEFRDSIGTGKPLMVVLSAHGALLKPTWKEEDRRIYEELFGHAMPEGWLEQYIIPYPRGETFRIYSKLSGQSIAKVEDVAKRVRTEMRTGHTATPLPGALDFVKMLTDKRIPVVVVSGGEHSIIRSQLETAGFVRYLSDENIITAPEGQVHTEGTTQAVIAAVAERYPGYTMITFDDRTRRVKDYRAYEAVTIGYAHGDGRERTLNRVRLRDGGYDCVIDGWQKAEVLVDMIQAANREAALVSVGLNGATGSVGAPFVRALLGDDTRHLTAQVHTPESRKTRERIPDDARIDMEKAGLFNTEKIRSLFKKSNVVYHLAGWVGAGRRRSQGAVFPQPAEMLALNSLSTALMARMAKKYHKRLVFASSAAVYLNGVNRGGALREDSLQLAPEVEKFVRAAVEDFGRVDENIFCGDDQADKIAALAYVTRFLESHPMPDVPNLYGLTKIIGERLVSEHDQGVSLRLWNIYGRGDETERRIPGWIRALTASTREPLVVRDEDIAFTHIDTVIDVLKRAATYDLGEDKRVVNVTGDETINAVDAAEHIKALARSRRPIVREASPEGTVSRLAIDTSLMKSVFTGAVQIPFEEGIRRTYSWLTDRERWRDPNYWVGSSKERAEPSRETAEKVDAIHTKNLSAIPHIPDRTVICHIITDSILPDSQKGMLKQLEQEMRGRNDYFEKVVALSVGDADGSDMFLRKLDTIRRREEKRYNALGYAVRFDVACPTKELVRRVQRDYDIPALAFAKEGEGDIIQVEGIILALRVLFSGTAEDLLKVYSLLTGREFRTTINDIKELARHIVFILPVTKLDVDSIERLNARIKDNIKNAA